MGMGMHIPRRFLPSIPLLTAFETVARTNNISAAARELSLTQSAVSRQIKALEEQLGADLFYRDKQSIRLTLAGDSYARDIRDALRRISTASLNFRANPAGGTLNLAVLPTFGARWLAPRLPRFVARHADVVLNLVSRHSTVDFHAEPIDAAIDFGHRELRSADTAVETADICGEEVLPVCAPRMKRQYKFRKPADLRAAPLLHLIGRPDAWERWLAAQAAPAEGIHGMMFDQFETIIHGAVAGLGLALLPRFLITAELQRRELVAALDRPLTSPERYYLIWPTERAAYPPLVTFRNWLRRETADQGEA